MKKFLGAVVFAFISVLAFSQERIAVFPFEDMENVLTRNQALMFYREFSNEFTSKYAGIFRVVPRQDVERLINTEAAFQISDFSARAKTAEMQRVLNGTRILSGLIGKLGNNIRITVSLYTYPELEQLPGGATVSVANTTELFNKIPELVQSMQNSIVGGGREETIPLGLNYEIVDGKTVTLTSYSGNAATLNIPEYIEGLPVTAISEFVSNYRRTNDILTSVTIPSSVKYIEEFAFSGCENLMSVTISWRTQVRRYAFPNSVRIILQVGTYRVPRNAVGIFDKLKSAGLNPAYQPNNDYYNVVLPNLRAEEIPAIIQILEGLALE